MFSKSMCGCPMVAPKLDYFCPIQFSRKIVIVEFPKRAVDRNAGGPWLSPGSAPG